MPSVGSKLLDEIERVSGLRAQYESLRGTPGVNVEWVIGRSTAAIDRAKQAMKSDDPAEAIAALRDLEGFTG
jgi:hypothetical protein